MTKHQNQMRELLALYAGRGVTLAHISGGGIMNRKISTLKAYCRRYGISFPDYKPGAKRTKKQVAA